MSNVVWKIADVVPHAIPLGAWSLALVARSAGVFGLTVYHGDA